MHEVLVNRLGGLSLPRKSVVRLTDRPDMTLDVDRGRKTTIQQQIQGTQEGVRNSRGKRVICVRAIEVLLYICKRKCKFQEKLPSHEHSSKA